MLVSSIQGQLNHSAKGSQSPNTQYSIGNVNDLKSDSFSKNSNNVAFKANGDFLFKGIGAGTILGGLVGVAACIATAGTAVPFLAAYYGGLAATAAAGGAVGHAIDKLDEGPSGKKDDK